MKPEEIVKFVNNRAKAMDQKITEAILETTLDDLGFDSLDKIELLCDLSDKTSTSLGDSKPNHFKTVKDIVDYFKER